VVTKARMASLATLPHLIACSSPENADR